MTKSELTSKDIDKLIGETNDILVIQADNPDGDSLGSALALEEILAGLGKNVRLYCGIDIPSYLRYFKGWDRVERELPHKFDLAILVDAASTSLLEVLNNNGQLQSLAKKPLLILDHHETSDAFEGFDARWFQKPAVATAELIYDLAQANRWPLSHEAKQHITAAIMSDSLGLTSEATTAHSVRVIADLVEQGVNLSSVDAARREYMKKSPELVAYKGKLLQRIEYWSDERIATIAIPWEEIEKYSPLYNPSMLVIEEMRMTENVEVAIAFKIYKDGKVTGKIRTNPGHGIAADLAQAFGGGGHSYASGFKTQATTDFESLRTDIIHKAIELLDGLNK